MQRKFYDINRYMKSIANDVEITCDEIIDIPGNSNDIKAKIKMDSHILRTTFISNHIVINSCYCFLLLHQSKQKDILLYE